MFRHKPPIICRVPAIANVSCPKCEKVFPYLADSIDTDKPHPINKCPKCSWILDEDFYHSIQHKYKVVEFKSLAISNKFYGEFRKRKKGKRYLDDADLIKKYESTGLLWVHQESFDVIKQGYVWEFPHYKPLTQVQKIYNKCTEVLIDIFPFLDGHL